MMGGLLDLFSGELASSEFLSMGFDSPYNAVLLAIVPALLGLRAAAAKRNARALARFRPRGGDDAQAQPPVERLRPGLLGVGLALLVIAAMQPRWGLESEDVPSRGRDIVVLLDVSQSMLAEEGGRTRLDRARIAIGELVDAISVTGGHRLALIAFAGRASLLCPLTSDYDLFRERLAAASPDKAPRAGSHLGYGIRQALHGFGGLTRDYSDIVLVSDGEDHGSAPISAAKNAADLGVSIYAVGIGDAEIGAPVPAPLSRSAGADTDAIDSSSNTADGAGRPIMAHNGAPVLSRMNAELLSKMARLSAGAYLGETVADVRLGEFYERHIAAKPRRELETRSSQSAVHRYRWFAGAALVLLIIDMLWRTGGPGRRPSPRPPSSGPGRRSHGATAVVALAALGLVGFRLWSTPADVNEDGNEAFAAADYAAAIANYDEALQQLRERDGDRLASEAVLHYNKAGAEFKQFRLSDACDSYTRAADDIDTALAAAARYNLGNVKYQQALNAMQTFQDAVTPTREAITWLRASLELDPEQPDALYNLELALEMLRQLDRQKIIVQQSREPSGEGSSSAYSLEGDSSSPRGGDEDKEEPENPSEGDDRDAEQALKSPSQSEDEPPPGGGSKEAATQREMTAEQAEQMIEIARDRHEAAAAQRQQWRRARMHDGEVAKAW
ncbi:MAG: VWA domain-containing protein [Gammaproteobacteria bacterium]